MKILPYSGNNSLERIYQDEHVEREDEDDSKGSCMSVSGLLSVTIRLLTEVAT